MSIKQYNILEKIEEEIENFYSVVLKMLQTLDNAPYVRNERSSSASMFQYIYEVIKPNSPDEDDYGIVIDFRISEHLSDTTIHIDVSKGNGPIYFEEYFSMSTEKNKDDPENVFNSIQSLPELIVEIYRKDYSE